MSLDILIPTTFSGTFEKRLKNELVIGKLATTKFEADLKYGDECNVTMPGSVTMSDWDGGDLNDVETIKASTVKVKVNKGKQVNFELEKDKEIQINQAKGDKKIELIKEYSSDTLYQFRDALDVAYGLLHVKAGYKLDNSGSAIAITQANASKYLTAMRIKFQRGTDKGTAWKEGKMAAMLPPEYVGCLLNSGDLKYTESGRKELKEGYIGYHLGWKIYLSNNTYYTNDSTPVHYPLFGVEGEAMAGAVQKTIDLVPYMREKSLNKAYKGGGVLGVNGHRSDKLGTMVCTLDYNAA